MITRNRGYVFALAFMTLALMSGCHHEQPKAPQQIIVQYVPEPKAPDEQTAENFGAAVSGGTYRAGKAVYEYATSDETADKARRAKEYVKSKVKAAADYTSESMKLSAGFL